jgi:tripartite-type tricarboxylate transporter receptor subunit TctC
MSRQRRRLLATGAAAPLAGIWGLPAVAQPEPLSKSRPIRILVGFQPGTPPEVVARILAEAMSRSTGFKFIVENRAGAGGTVAAEAVARSAPDGHTLMLGVAASLAVAPHLLGSVKYSPVNDFSAIGFVQRSPYFVTVNADTPIRSIRDLVEANRAHPGSVSIAIPGLGTPHHLALELLMARTGTRFTVVPFPGSLPLVTETVSGRVTGCLDAAFPLLVDYVKQGRLRQIAITDSQRSSRFPEIATTVEQGYPDLTLYSWWGMVGPAGLPAAVVDYLNQTLNAAMATAEVRSRMTNEGFDERAQRTSSAAEFAGWIRTEYAQAGRVVREAGIRLQ